MTRTVAADAVMPARLPTAPTCPDATGAAVALAGPDPAIRRPSGPGRVRPPLLRHLPGASNRPEPRRRRPPQRHPVPPNAVTPAGWPADPGRDV
jgi:hypothetical protein